MEYIAVWVEDIVIKVIFNRKVEQYSWIVNMASLKS